MTTPRPEYPRPQFVRDSWLCLNGEWEFEIDSGNSGLERGLLERALSGTITVPFCPESQLSGVENTDFLVAVWYRRTVDLPKDWAGNRILLHFQAVDYDATIWANGREVGKHRGGFTPFTCDVTDAAAGSERLVVVVRARDEQRPPKPMGKQSTLYAPHSCFYTRTTGIWQTVWLEPVPSVSLKRPRITPIVGSGVFRIEQPLTANAPGWSVRATLTDAAGLAQTVRTPADSDFCPSIDLAVPKDRIRLWSPDDPFLYDILIELLDARGAVVDTARTYAGLRSVAIDGNRMLINGKPVFQRLVLDQGYYPDGVMTAPSDEALVTDITLSMAAGFNGARLHQKVFEERFLYHADRLGYLVWGEFGDWGGRGATGNHEQGITYATQWLEALERDYSHPAIVGWCPLNETWENITDEISTLDDCTRALFLAAKAADRTRPVLDASGYSHRVALTDIYDSHDYITDPEFAAGLAACRKRHERTGEGVVFTNGNSEGGNISTPYRGQPYFVSEFGGFRWAPERAGSAETWGYGSDPKSLDEFYARFEAVCALFLDNPDMFGYCYTQLTDIYPEENGLVRFDRTLKFDMARLRAIQKRPAAYESR